MRGNIMTNATERPVEYAPMRDGGPLSGIGLVEMENVHPLLGKGAGSFPEGGPVRSLHGALVLEDGARFEGVSFGYDHSVAGEVVFCTGMVGYPEALTDASFAGQILIMTYPILGNYGVPIQSRWEDDKIQISGLIVSHYVYTRSHGQSVMNLGSWLRREKVPALEIKDTRMLAQHIRQHGVMLGK